MAALFSKAAKAGLDADYVREELAPAVIGKRLSEADNKEVFRVVERIAGLYNPPQSPNPPLPPLEKGAFFIKGGSYGYPHPALPHRGGGKKKKYDSPSPPVGEGWGEGARKKYDSSRAGLVRELEDAARARWGAGFEEPLNRLINHNRRVPTHYRFLRVTELKAFKDRIREMNLKDGRTNG